jgi:hypothetical protein
MNYNPYPILDNKEKELLTKLAEEYTKFTEPGIISKSTQYLQDGISQITPQVVKEFANEGMSKIQSSIKKVTDGEFVQTTLEQLVKGYGHFNETLVKYTLSENGIVKDFKKIEPNLESIEEICLLRSYTIEGRAANLDIIPIGSAFLNGGVMGLFGLPGIPINLVISYFLYFRFVQQIAMYYGYNVHQDPRELEFASDVVLECLSPSKESGAKNLAGAIGRIKLLSEFDALKIALAKRHTFGQLLEKGGIEAAYVQIRSFGHKSAMKALDKAGIDQVEVGVFKKLMERVGGVLTKEVAKKALPVISAVVGAFSDVFYIKRILKGANLIYHKRFLLEKESRIKRLNNIIDYSYEIAVTDELEVNDKANEPNVTDMIDSYDIADETNVTDGNNESN